MELGGTLALMRARGSVSGEPGAYTTACPYRSGHTGGESCTQERERGWRRGAGLELGCLGWGGRRWAEVVTPDTACTARPSRLFKSEERARSIIEEVEIRSSVSVSPPDKGVEGPPQHPTPGLPAGPNTQYSNTPTNRLANTQPAPQALNTQHPARAPRAQHPTPTSCVSVENTHELSSKKRKR